MGPRLTRLAKRTSQSSPAQRVLSRLEARHDDVLRAVGRLECHLLDARQAPPERLEDVEFKVYSQFGEDGILQYLIRQAKVPDTTFVEIGVGDYRESNTRFLVENNNWRGLAIDHEGHQVAQWMNARTQLALRRRAGAGFRHPRKRQRPDP